MFLLVHFREHRRWLLPPYNQSLTKSALLDHPVHPCIEGRGKDGAMIVFAMIGILACLAFLCVSPVISHLAPRKPASATPSKPRPIRKGTFSAR